jgi:5-methylcytosine-specific restriction endonuclease McrA
MQEILDYNMLDEKQKLFLKLHVMDQVPMAQLPEKIGVERSILSKWYDGEIKSVRLEIARIRNIWSRKKIKGELEEFYNWYKGLVRKCTYCGINENELNHLIDSKLVDTKRLPTRGRTLELDRMQPNLSYEDKENLHLCCYWCNNAKTDTFTHQEFLEIGKAISAVWKKRMKELKF